MKNNSSIQFTDPELQKQYDTHLKDVGIAYELIYDLMVLNENVCTSAWVSALSKILCVFFLDKSDSEFKEWTILMRTQLKDMKEEDQ